MFMTADLFEGSVEESNAQSSLRHAANPARFQHGNLSTGGHNLAYL
jgi:hypothetical protein